MPSCGDRRPATPTGPAGSTVDPQPATCRSSRRNPVPAAPHAPGGDPDRRGPVGTQQRAGPGDEPRQGRVIERRDRRERVDALDEQHLVLVLVPDPGHGALIQEGLRDGQDGSRRFAQTSDCLGGIEFVCAQVRAKRAERRMERRRPAFQELDHGSVEAHGDCAGDLEDQRGPARRAAPPLPRRVAMPGAGHAEVRPEFQPVGEADQQVLAVRLDGQDLRADHAVHARAGNAGPGGEQRAPDQVRA